jgi:hypothetical protein
MLCFISIFALSAQFVIFFFESGSFVYVLISFTFGIIVTIWSSTTLYFWQRKENVFCLQFGMFGIKSEETNSQERPGFKGFYRRSLVNDNLNTVHFENYKRFFK